MRELLAAGIISLLASMSGVNIGQHHHSGLSIDTDTDGEVTTCNDVSVRFDHQKAVMQSEEVPVSDLRALKVVDTSHGGIRVVGWDQPRYAVTACKAAAVDSALRDVRVSVNGNEVSASGPDNNDWVVLYLVRAPKNATLDLDTANGPISVRDLDATLNAHAKNGPVTLKHTNGSIDVTTKNGPIAYSGTSGSVKLSAANGPVAVRLLGSQWNGSLDGRSENGPISLKVPPGFNARVVMTSEGRGPIACRLAACREASRALRDSLENDEDAPRTMTFGSGAGNISLTTVNGPIAVKEADE